MGDNSIFDSTENFTRIISSSGTYADSFSEDTAAPAGAAGNVGEEGFHVARPTGFQVVLLFDSGVFEELWLPYAARGKYFFQDKEEKGVRECLFIEAQEGKWTLKCVQPICFSDNYGHSFQMVELFNQCLINIENLDCKCMLYVEEVNEESSIFHNYLIFKEKDITIGRSRKNDIVYPNNLVSRKHAVLHWENELWNIKDNDSKNGLYVNGRKEKDKQLDIGDVVYIWGLRIIIGAGFLSVNDGNQRIQVDSDALFFMESTDGADFLEEPPTDGGGERGFFNRLPRQRTALVPENIEIESPPMSLDSNGIPLILRMGSSVVMSGSAALSGHYAMILSSLVFPILSQKYTDKEKKEYELRRVEKYTEYLEEKKREIQEEKRKEETILNKNYPEISRVLNYSGSSGEKRHLWERRNINDDFLCVRVGTGKVPMMAEIDYPKHRFDMDEDKLQNDMYSLVETPVFLEDVPIIVSLVENDVCGITGEKRQTLEFLKRMIMQISLLHSYDEVKTVFLLEKEELKELEFIKFLPHVWDDQRTIRFIATEESEAFQIGEFLKEEVGGDLEKPRKLEDILKTRPYYVVFALSKRIFDSMEVFKEVMRLKESCGISILTVFDDLPKECTGLLQLEASGKNSVIYLQEIDRKKDTFRMDEYDVENAVRSMREIANTRLKLAAQGYTLPKQVTFLEMFGAGKIEHLNILKRWQESNPVKSLAAPVGMAADGNPFYLDLHQKFQGPHGLVAGMTGSGKSEFIITYILSMAVNYHPDEVAFILIDYKGGGLTGAFEDKERGIHLPHLVGTITNLDGAAIQRSLISIQSELKRRQKIFNKAKSAANEGTMDIYDYQRLYRQHVVEEPMPHLFIISDEFAELKQQKPEFMDQLISIARIGRSLGVHLILATQKPAGVVNDQIRSNTKFRVCLKVQDRADSMDMLKRPEAAELKETGRFYLQVGYNEYFALGQSAWSGAFYEPQDEVVIKKDDAIEFIDTVGQVIQSAKPEVQKNHTGKTQLVELVQTLSDLAKEIGLEEKQLWKEPLKNKIAISELENYYPEKTEAEPIQAYLGMLDDPENQEQFPFVFDFQNCRNVLVAGESASGKTTFFQSMILSLADRYSPEEVNFYILDYSGSGLSFFKNLPHCGVLLGEGEETEIKTFFDLITEIIEGRKQLFARLEVSTFESARAICPLPLILVCIDNVTGLSGSKKGETFFYKLQDYVKEGVSYGVKYLISCSHLNELSMRVKQELAGRIALHLKDRYEYMDAIGCRCSYVPSEIPGRGLYNYEGAALEMQLAEHMPELSDRDRVQFLKEEVLRLREKYQNFETARGIPEVPEAESYEDFMQKTGKAERLPLGYSLKNAKPVALPFRQFSMLSLYFGNPLGAKPVINNILCAAAAQPMDIYIFKKEKDSYIEEQELEPETQAWREKAHIMDTNEQEIANFCNVFLQEFLQHKEVFTAYCKEQGIDRKQKDVYKRTFKYMWKHTKPTLLLIEGFRDFGKCMNEVFEQAFLQFFKLARKYNIYFIGCFYPDDKVIGYNVFKNFNPEELVLLFGGQFDRQEILSLPREYIKTRGEIPYNRCLMKYREEYHTLMMPCGELPEEALEEDEINIFE